MPEAVSWAWRHGRTAQHRTAEQSRSATASPVAAALSLLDRLEAAAADAERDGSLVEIRVLQGLAHHILGDLPGALAALERALVEAPEPDSSVRLFLDEGAPMLALLRDVADLAGRHARHDPDEPSEALQTHARRLLDRATTPAPSRQEQLLADQLSQRELQVLRLLDSDLTGPEIARELYISLNTLRTHTRRIFTKLDARTRVAAVRRAHELGLL